MPTDTNLPTMVHLYLEMIDKIHYSMTDIDTGTKAYETMNREIQYYFDLIRTELRVTMRQEHGEDYATRFNMEKEQ